MSWTGNPSTPECHGRLAAVHEADAIEAEIRNWRAARVVASRALDAADCAEMLAMLGLDAAAERIG